MWIILNDRLPFYKADCLSGVTPLVQFASSVPIAAGNIDFLPRYFHLGGKDFAATSAPITSWCPPRQSIALAHCAL